MDERERRRQRRYREAMRNRIIAAAFLVLLIVGIIFIVKGCKDKKQAQEEQASADPEIDALVAARTEAKKAKNFAEADRIRDELKTKGVEVTDIPNGAKWKRV